MKISKNSDEISKSYWAALKTVQNQSDPLIKLQQDRRRKCNSEITYTEFLL